MQADDSVSVANANIFSNVESTAKGNGGGINITTGSLFVTNGAALTASTRGQGDAGNIFVNVRGTLQANDGIISTTSNQFSGGAIDVTAKDIRLLGNSDIATSVFSGAGSGGNINLTTNSIITFNDSDILAYARDGSGGNITFNTPVFFEFSYASAPPGTDPRTLNGNNRVDINASGAIAAGNITLPDVSFLQNSFIELPANLIDTNRLVANSCIARSNQQGGSFIITGAGGFPMRPGDAFVSPYPTGTVRSIPSSGDKSETPRSSVSSTKPARPWKLGDPIVELQGLYHLANGQLVLSRESPH